MFRKSILLLAATLQMLALSAAEPQKSNLRAPAVPLITIDPYTSGWSMTDKLYESPVRHWTGTDFHFVGSLLVDGVAYRFMGDEIVPMQGIAPISHEQGWSGAYTFDEPAADWIKKDFNDSAWSHGEAAFGTQGNINVHTLWTSEHIWARRTITLSEEDLQGGSLFVKYSHDDTCQIYFNGIEIVSTPFEWNANRWVEIPAEVAATAKDGKVVLAAHCHNPQGDALLDMGLYKRADGDNVLSQTAEQKSVDVEATRTIYEFACGGVDLTLTFTAPLLLDNLDLVSRPVNYITYDVVANDGKKHDVAIYFEATQDWARNAHWQECKSELYSDKSMNYIKCGTTEQPVLEKRGDNIRIDWGYFYLAADKKSHSASLGGSVAMRKEFVANGIVAPNNEGDHMSLSAHIGKVGNKPKSDYIMLGYDDLYSIRYFGEDIRPYWNRNGDSSIEEQFQLARKQYSSLIKQCEAFDAQMIADATRVGGREYAELCALAYRQSISAHKLILTPQGYLAWLSKENFSNGCIGTLDITYPSAPLFLYYNIDLCKAMMDHIFYYSESGKWTKPFPAHDVGTYPHVFGQAYGEDMPVEEGGNMIILMGAIAALEGNADYAVAHWDTITTWTNYLIEYGFDPQNQLCTDDFAGHSARNTNLSIKAIMAIRAYAEMAHMAGKQDIYDEYLATAERMAAKWKKMAAQGDHYRRTFNEGDTWSQKYNLVWDKLLGYNLFDADIADSEVAFYLKTMNEYGLPLDERRNYTKSDWIVWSATMADSKAEFEQFIAPMYRFYNETVDRVPMGDWYNTDSKHHIMFRARSVVGGYFIKLLEEKLLNN